jgi:site-specific recombinase XerD
MDVFDALTPLAAKRLRASAVGAYAQTYFDRLRVQGYAALTVGLYLNCLAHFALWSIRRRFDLTALDRHAEFFVRQHLPRCCCAGPVQRTAHCVRAALKHFKAVVVDAGIVVAEPTDPIDASLQRFDCYLQRIRGLAASTRRQRLAIVRPLASMAGGCLPSPELVRSFVHQQLSHLTPASALVTTTAVRSWLRFLAFEGERVDQLLPLVASPANWRLAPLPQTLTPPEVERLLDAFPTDLPSRLRCLAIMRCVVDLGLRSSEVVALEFDDIDWTAGTVRIGKAKSRRVDMLPLPQSTGAAIAQYVRRERPRTASRRIFVRHVAPVDAPVTANVVRRTVREAYRRAGLPYTRVHILRHTLASRLLNNGGTLKEVADVLRHRELDTSLIYAKVDFTRLGAVAMPWPGSKA